MIRLLVTASAVLGLTAAGPPLAGRAVVADGDTLSVAGVRVRLWGVDAPEGRQLCLDARGQSYRCGQVAREHLASLIGAEPVSCVMRDHDAYGRTVAQCRGGGRDLGEAMIRSGWAVEYRQFSHGGYASAEAEARGRRRGLWAGSFEPPSAWRAHARTERAAPAPPPSTRCALKGNINGKGRRIVHAPGQQDYAATSINTARGERWFCTLAEAAAAGWSPARR